MLKRLFFSLAMAAICCTSLPAQSTQDFKQMIKNYWQTWSAMDTDKSAAMYIKNPDAIFFDVTPMKYNGWDEYAAGVRKAFATTASAKFTPNDDIHAERHGDFAWTAETFRGVLTDKDGKTSELNGRHTAIWQKVGGKWLIIHDHVSCPLP